MAIAFAVGSKSTPGSGSTATTAAVTTTGGSGSVFLVFVSRYSENNLTSVTDNKGNGNFTQVGTTVTNGTGGFYTYIFKFEGGTGGASHTFTANFSTSNWCACSVIELTGCATSNAVDQSTGLADNTTPYASGAVSITGTQMLVGFGADDLTGVTSWAVDSASVPTSGWTQQSDATITSGTALLIATQRVTSEGSPAFVFTQTGGPSYYNSSIVTVKEAGITQSNAPRAFHQLMRGIG